MNLKFGNLVFCAVTLPLIVQTFFLYFMNSSIESLKRLHLKDLELAELMRGNVDLNYHLMSCISSAALFKATKSKHFEQRFEESLDSALRQNRILSSSLRRVYGNSIVTNEFIRVGALFEKAAIDGRVARGSKGELSEFSRALAYKDLAKLINLVNKSSMLQLSSIYASRRDAAAKYSEQERKLQSLVFSSIVFMLFVVLASAIWLKCIVASRFRALSSNIKRLGSGLAIEIIEGKDEFAELNQVINRTQTALDESAMQQKALFSTAAEIICFVGEGLRIEEISSATSSILRLEPENLIGAPFVILFENSKRVSVSSKMSALLQTKGVAPIKFETSTKLVSGDYTYLDWTVTWSERFKRFYCLAYDKTERKNNELMRKRLYEMISHDIRSPMTSIFLTVDTLQQSDATDISVYREKLSRISHSLKQVIDLTNDFLELEKMEETCKLELSVKEVSTKKLILDSVESVRALADAKLIDLNLEIFDSIIPGDERQLYRVFVNLISNAVKFSKEESTITIRCLDNRDKVRFEVIDEGPGIDAEHLVHIFDRYYQVSRVGSKLGYGLGLAICKMIIDSHSGKIEVESTVGKGTKFIVDLKK